jgi:hypothetical protein
MMRSLGSLGLCMVVGCVGAPTSKAPDGAAKEPVPQTGVPEPSADDTDTEAGGLDSGQAVDTGPAPDTGAPQDTDTEPEDTADPFATQLEVEA